MLRLEAPLTKGGRFPLVSHEFNEAHLARLHHDNRCIKGTQKPVPWNKTSVAPYQRVNMIYLMHVHGLSASQIAHSLGFVSSTVSKIIQNNRQDKRIFSLHTLRSKILMLGQRADSINCQSRYRQYSRLEIQ